jgi:diguanylate cyclase
LCRSREKYRLLIEKLKILRFRFLTKDKQSIWMITKAKPVVEEGCVVGIHGALTNITELKKAEEETFVQQEQFKTTLLLVDEGVISMDNQGNITVLNPTAEKLAGRTREETLGKPFKEVFNIIHEYTKEPFENPAQNVLATGDVIKLADHAMFISKTGREIPIEGSAAPIKNSVGQRTGVIIVFRDLIEKRKKTKQVEYLIFHDHLTGLYNRRYMEDSIKRLDTERNLPFTIMVLDVNGLKYTNDTFGHEMGDRLLKTIADTMAKVCRADEIICRIGGGEFAILFPNTNEKQAEAIKKRITKAISKINLGSVIVSLAIGYAVKTSKDQNIEDIKINADCSMYKNKLSCSNVLRNQTIEIALRSINDKYDREQIHTIRVSQYCEAIARAMGLREKEIDDIKTAGILHDIGKFLVPAELLNKPGRLTAEESEAIKQHPKTGYQMLKSVDEYAALAEFILYHHERWDGKGYPEGLRGEDIPLESRIIAVADAYEAMTAKRLYQRTKNKEEAIAELKKCAGTQFDPAIVEVFVEKVL